MGLRKTVFPLELYLWVVVLWIKCRHMPSKTSAFLLVSFSRSSHLLFQPWSASSKVYTPRKFLPLNQKCPTKAFEIFLYVFLMMATADIACYFSFALFLQCPQVPKKAPRFHPQTCPHWVAQVTESPAFKKLIFQSRLCSSHFIYLPVENVNDKFTNEFLSALLHLIYKLDQSGTKWLCARNHLWAFLEWARHF